MTHDVIIIGSGPSGVAAAMGFAENGIVPLILDVGNEAPDITPPDANFYDYRRTNESFDIMIGENYEVLKHIINRKTTSPKISSPYMQFVTKGAERLGALSEGASIVQSFSLGGLANAWGAALYRCIDDELANTPFKASELTPYYDKLTAEIGISGHDDDLTPFFGSTEGLQEPIKLSEKSSRLLSAYKKRKKKFNDRGIYMGRSRLGVLTEDLNGRHACNYHGVEMWFPDLPYIYTPSFTLRKLIEQKKVDYQKSVVVKSWTRANEGFIVHAHGINDNVERLFKCKKLILAAGTINSAKIVLATKKDFTTKLLLKDNSLLQFPLIFPSFVGSKLEKDALSLTNLNIIFEMKKTNMRLQGSIIELTSPARSMFYEMLPLSARHNLTFIRMFLPSLLVLFLYLPSRKENLGHIRLEDSNKLEVSNPHGRVDGYIMTRVARTLLRMGVLTHPAFVKPPEHTMHYAGTFPAVDTPESEYQCDRWGELYGEPGVHLVDGSVFSYVPAKNMSFTLMANAMRIADHIAKGMNSH